MTENQTNDKSEFQKLNDIISFQYLSKLQNKILAICNWQEQPVRRLFFKSLEIDISKTGDSKGSEIVNSNFCKDIELVIKSIKKEGIPKALNSYLKGGLNHEIDPRFDLSKDQTI